MEFFGVLLSFLSLLRGTRSAQREDTGESKMGKNVVVEPLRLQRTKTHDLTKRFARLPKWQQDLIREDMETAFENRIIVMERINGFAGRNS